MIDKVRDWLHLDCDAKIKHWEDKYKEMDMQRIVLEGERTYIAEQLNTMKKNLIALGDLHCATLTENVELKKKLTQEQGYKEFEARNNRQVQINMQDTMTDLFAMEKEVQKYNPDFRLAHLKPRNLQQQTKTLHTLHQDHPLAGKKSDIETVVIADFKERVSQRESSKRRTKNCP